ncbi:MAG: LysR family transcriptional regulator [Bacteroidia bacterium]|nr:LysR family transcriptional regulator [Bacteroidia bacterium]MBP6722103.1 LysR family transcriptional regulator [Bacteroidia bacterium]
MNYTLHQLQVFLKVTQTKSVTKAAEELLLSQPGVSIQLRNFQDQFSQPLTEVVGRRIYITDFGRQIAALAENILNEVATLNDLAQSNEGMLHGKLKMAVVSTGKYIMPFFLASFLRQHSGIELQMDVTNRAKVLEALEKNEVDFALVSILPTSIKTEHVGLMENRLVLVGQANGLESDVPLPPSVMEGLPMIYRESGSGTRVAMEQFILKNKLRVKKKIELSSNEAVKQAVLAGLGYSIMPLIGIRTELNHQQLRIVPVQGLPIVTTWNLVWVKDKRFSLVAEAYLAHLESTKKQIISEFFDFPGK